MIVNGQRHPHRNGLTLHALLDELRIDQTRVVVMVGEEIYRRNLIPDVAVDEPDVIEIVTMMQGG